MNFKKDPKGQPDEEQKVARQIFEEKFEQFQRN